MRTVNQFFSLKKKKQKNNKVLSFCPQKKGICLKFTIQKPKKPNSARRKTVKIKLSNNNYVMAYIMGIGNHNLQKFSQVLVRGGNIIDLPGISHKLIRGKYDLEFIYDRVSSRSKYGKPKN